jgi:hypothetical protein
MDISVSVIKFLQRRPLFRGGVPCRECPLLRVSSLFLQVWLWLLYAVSCVCCLALLLGPSQFIAVAATGNHAHHFLLLLSMRTWISLLPADTRNRSWNWKRMWHMVTSISRITVATWTMMKCMPTNPLITKLGHDPGYRVAKCLWSKLIICFSSWKQPQEQIEYCAHAW